MIEVFTGAFLGVLLGYFATDYRDWRQVQAKRQMLFSLLISELNQIPPRLPEYDPKAIFHRHPIALPALDALLDGITLSAKAPYFLVDQLLRLRTTVFRYNNYVSVNNSSAEILLSHPSYHRNNYDVLHQIHEEILAVRDEVLAIAQVEIGRGATGLVRYLRP